MARLSKEMDATISSLDDMIAEPSQEDIDNMVLDMNLSKKTDSSFLPQSSLVTGFRKKMSELKDPRMSREAEFDVGYPTGFLGFDFMNGVKVKVQNFETGQTFFYNSIGIVDGTMVSVVGRSGCGKTTFVLQSAGNIVRPFPEGCIFHEEIESGSSAVRKRQLMKMSEEYFNGHYILRNTGITTENFLQRVQMIHDMKVSNRSYYEYDTGLYDTSGNRIFKLQPTVVILDSLALLMPEDIYAEEGISSNMTVVSIAKKNTNLIKKIMQLLKAANIIFFVINHLLPDPSPTPKKAQVAWLRMGERCPGGETAIYLANNLIRMDDNSKLKADKEFGIDGIMVDLEFVKSRTNNAGKKVPMVLSYKNGFEQELSLYVLMKQYGMINGAGAYMYITDNKEYKFTQKGLKEKIRTDVEFRNIFMTEAMNLLSSLVNDCTNYGDTADGPDIDISSMMITQMRQPLQNYA